MTTYFLDTADGVKHELPVILHANGSVSDFRPEDDRLLVPALVRALGGDYEDFPLSPWKNIHMIVRDGPGGEYNYRASLMAQRRIQGDVVILQTKEHTQNENANEHQSES